MTPTDLPLSAALLDLRITPARKWLKLAALQTLTMAANATAFLLNRAANGWVLLAAANGWVLLAAANGAVAFAGFYFAVTYLVLWHRTREAHNDPD